MSTVSQRLVGHPINTATSSEYISRFSTSWLLTPLQLAIWRGLISLYAFVVLFISLGVEGSKGRAGQSFSFFTVLGYWGLAFYYAISAVHSASFWYRERAYLQDWSKALQYAHSTYYATVTVFPFIVTGVFWGALSVGAFDNEYSTWSNISQHALNSVFAFCEIVIPRAEAHPWINMPILIVLLALYLGLAYLTHTTQGYYVYGFLDPKIGKGIVTGACFGILAAAIIIFVVVHWVIKLRIWVTEQKLGMDGKFTTRQQKLNKTESHGFVEMTSHISTKV